VVLSIGEFSKITCLSIKTLRFYHDQGLLTPARVDPQTGYRYYDHGRVEKARAIAQLRSLEFSLNEIREMLADSDDEADIIDCLERQKSALQAKCQQYRAAVSSLERVIHNEKEARRAMQDSTFMVEEKVLDTLLIAAVRIKGKFGDSGKGFARIGKSLGRYISGKSFLLHYDSEFKEDDADFEACMPVREGQPAEGISIRELAGGRCVSLLHKGPYEQMGSSYQKVFGYIKGKGYEITLPTREVYIKGPGVIFRGNPKNYLTEIQVLIQAPLSS
jgi:DNA-binding transcriptional MerR regulator/effector-binding domain-containing protein